MQFFFFNAVLSQSRFKIVPSPQVFTVLLLLVTSTTYPFLNPWAVLCLYNFVISRMLYTWNHIHDLGKPAYWHPPWSKWMLLLRSWSKHFSSSSSEGGRIHLFIPISVIAGSLVTAHNKCLNHCPQSRKVDGRRLISSSINSLRSHTFWQKVAHPASQMLSL